MLNGLKLPVTANGKKEDTVQEVLTDDQNNE